MDVGHPTELSKLNHELEVKRLVKQFHHDSTRDALRTAFLANAGGLAALLTYLGTRDEQLESGMLLVLGVGALAFIAGIVVALVCAIATWHNQEAADFPDGNIKGRGHAATRGVLWWAPLLFVLGAIASAAGIGWATVEQHPTRVNALSDKEAPARMEQASSQPKTVQSK